MVVAVGRKGAQGIFLGGGGGGGEVVEDLGYSKAKVERDMSFSYYR